VQDFTWARGAAGAGDAATLLPGISGYPTVALTLSTDCHWTTTISTAASGPVTDPNHSMTAATLLSRAPTLTCAGTPGLALPVTFTFTAQGYTSSAGSISFSSTAGSGQTFPLDILSSGSIIRSSSAS
jgi:hypothetical protein